MYVILKVLLCAVLAAIIPDQTVPTIKTVAIGNGITLHYVEAGRGTPLIFVHGSLSDGGYWSNQIGEFAKHYHVIVYSRRYNFPNVNPSRPGYSAITDADDLSALIERLHLGKVNVVGHSYGALTALFLAVMHPEQLCSVVLAEPPAATLLNHLPTPETARGRAMFQDMQQRMVNPMKVEFSRGQREAGVATFIDYVFNDHRAWDKFSPAAKRQTMRDAHEWDVMMTRGTLFPDINPSAIARIRLPVLILSGGRSYPFLRLIDDELARLIPGSEQVIFPRDGHQMWYQEPVRSRQTVEAFLAKAAACRQHLGER